MVDFHKVFILFELFLRSVERINAGWSIIVVSLVMDDTIDRQAVGEGWVLIRPTEGDGCNRHHKARQTERLDNRLRVIDGCS